MPAEIWGSVGVIALVDAVNFPVMLMLVFILGRANAFRNGLAYSVGMLGMHFAGGFIFAAGLSDFAGRWLTALGRYVGLIEMAVGIGLLLFGLFSKEPTDDLERRMWRARTSLAGWFAVGFAITWTKLPIAALYATAVHRIDTHAANSAWFVAGLAYYNVIAFLPFFIIWAVWLFWRQRSDQILGEINELIRRSAATVMKYGMMIAGGVLMADGIARFYGAGILL